jgi:hypothetical protein
MKIGGLPMHYFAAWTDSGLLHGCDHEHATVISAAACIANAGAYVIAVEDGVLRELNDAEEKKLQHALDGGVEEHSIKGIAVRVSVKWSQS